MSRHVYQVDITNPETKAQSDALQTYTDFNASQHKDFSKLRPKQLKRTLSPIALLILILFRFQKENGRSPTEKDIGILNDLKTRYTKELGIPNDYPFNDELLSDLADKLDTEIAPVSAILGGILAQEIIKVLAANDAPLKNWYFYNGIDNSGIIQQL
ncbi:hypothetical protein K501DRAFT_308112 [Backusella circina FSU 941]|nr:hypothetical protein K501DRAFT_308112 [Backusella circina FSU 941]